jgi:hypothetical protein
VETAGVATVARVAGAFKADWIVTAMVAAKVKAAVEATQSQALIGLAKAWVAATVARSATVAKPHHN